MQRKKHKEKIVNDLTNHNVILQDEKDINKNNNNNNCSDTDIKQEKDGLSNINNNNTVMGPTNTRNLSSKEEERKGTKRRRTKISKKYSNRPRKRMKVIKLNTKNDGYLADVEHDGKFI